MLLVSCLRESHKEHKNHANKKTSLQRQHQESNQNLDDFVQQLTSPKLDSKSVTSEDNALSEMKEQNKLLPIDLPMSRTQKKKQKTNIRVCVNSETDEGIGVSCDNTHSCSGSNGNKYESCLNVCSEFSEDHPSDGKSKKCKANPEKNSEDSIERNKLSLSRNYKDTPGRFFRWRLPLPTRRHSSCSEEDIPTQPMFLNSSCSYRQIDTIESLAEDFDKLCSKSDELVFASSKERKVCSNFPILMNGLDLTSNKGAQMTRTRSLAFENIKRKFKISRNRRHTAAFTELPKAMAPNYDQCLQWSRSFDSLLHDKIGLELFKEYLKSEFSEDNLDFWTECEEYRYADESEMPELARKIHDNFVAYKGPKEVNLDSFTRMVTTTNLKNPSKDTFEKAQQKIQALMEKDSYPRFIKSSIYQKLFKKVSNVGS